MQLKVFTLQFDSLQGGFNDEVVRSFMQDKEVISIKDYFFVRHEVPYLTVVLQYTATYSRLDSGGSRFSGKQEDWRKMLGEADLGLFDRLRNWRLKRSQKEGVPPYILFSNAQLVNIVKSRPQTPSDLGKLDGIGQAKVERYGSDILEITKINLEISLTKD